MLTGDEIKDLIRILISINDALEEIAMTGKSTNRNWYPYQLQDIKDKYCRDD